MIQNERSPIDILSEIKNELNAALSADKPTQITKINEVAVRYKTYNYSKKDIQDIFKDIQREYENSINNTDDIIQDDEDLFEIPNDIKIPEKYQIKSTGVYEEKIYKKKSYLSRITTNPVYVSKKLKNIDTGGVGVKLSYCYDGKKKAINVSKSQISIRRDLVQLSSIGVPVTTENAPSLIKFLTDQQAASMATLPEGLTTEKSGWIKYEGHHYFSIGNKVIGPPNSTSIEREIPSDCSKEVRFVGIQSGTLEEWITAFKLIKKYNYVLLQFACGILAPLLDILEITGFTIHISGDSTRGKTVTTRFTLSAFGSPRKGHCLQTWLGTEVGLENRAYALTDLPVSLDDSSLARSPNIIENIVYAFANGSGTSRGKSDGGSHISKPIRVVGISNGEIKLTDESSKTGQSVRVLQITKGPFLPETNLTAGEVRKIDDLVEENYGHFYEPYLNHLVKIRNNIDLVEELRQRHRLIRSHLIETAENKLIGRISPILAGCHVALEMVSNLMPELELSKAEIESCISEAVQSQTVHLSKASNIGYKALSYLFDKIASEGHMRFDCNHNEQWGRITKRTLTNRERQEGYAFIKTQLFKLLREGGYDPGTVCDIFLDNNWVWKKKGGLYPVKMDRKTVKTYVFDTSIAIKEGILEPDENNFDSPAQASNVIEFDL